ncbi:MAG TPA: nucleoside-diphosphate kinase [Lentisphaeria bacterium]|nr:MAG: nucleoside-diphosphate kinase [Lentisphaerae bacterium GWF2_38_69]HBM16467.1 nucleoside-diphosphate kinase [Lentisphaeria bacterium]
MAIELSYVLITPYTIQKSRTGGIIARLLSRTDLELTGAKIFAPSQEFTDNYSDIIKGTNDNTCSQEALNLLSDYVKENFAPHKGRYQRVIMLLFRGENATKILTEVVGHIKPEIRTGETIRDTYSDYVPNRDGSVRYFEPAVITAPNIPGTDAFRKEMLFLANYLDSTPNIIDLPLLLTEDDSNKRTLVIIKPDNWRYPSSRPGNIIDMLSRTGLRIVGCKLYRMSLDEALEFYGPVKNALREKLAPKIGIKAKEIIEKELKIKLQENDNEVLTNSVGIRFADDQFSQIVEFMSGLRPGQVPEWQSSDPGKVKCMVLIYQGENAVNKIRDVLGPTDPTKAPGGTIRREFGTDVMVNTAHASDSFENAKREMTIIKADRNIIGGIIKDFYK